IAGTTDQVTVKNYFLGGDNLVTKIKFSTGGEFTAAQILNLFKLNPDTTQSPAYTNLPDEAAFGTVWAGVAGNQNLIGSSDADLL
ncbi:calcium-binding protein, partial [Parachitinimonas caeni]